MYHLYLSRYLLPLLEKNTSKQTKLEYGIAAEAFFKACRKFEAELLISNILSYQIRIVFALSLNKWRYDK